MRRPFTALMVKRHAKPLTAKAKRQEFGIIMTTKDDGAPELPRSRQLIIVGISHKTHRATPRIDNV